jgi:hypothetical protein
MTTSTGVLRRASAYARRKQQNRTDCPRLIHIWLPGSPPPVTTPGCEDCIALQRQYDSATQSMPAPTPKPKQPADMVEEDNL